VRHGREREHDRQQRDRHGGWDPERRGDESAAKREDPADQRDHGRDAGRVVREESAHLPTMAFGDQRRRHPARDRLERDEERAGQVDETDHRCEVGVGVRAERSGCDRVRKEVRELERAGPDDDGHPTRDQA
jgi:hypothetical protein